MDASIKLYLTFLVICIILWLVGLVLYTVITPVREMKLISAGNRSAAITSAATAIAIAAVIAAAASQTTDPIALLRMGGLAVVSQLFAFILIALLLPAFRAGINEDKLSYGIFMGGISIAVALLNVGAMISLSDL
jgi:putative membrane protein